MNRLVSISEVAEVNPSFPKTSNISPDSLVSFMPMAAVSESGIITVQDERPFGEVSKGYTYFANGDVLMAKITPCMENGKATFVQNLKHGVGFGSTEFHVLRPSSEVDGKYLFYIIWNSMFRKVAERNMTGTAGQKRVPSSFLKEFKIPLPPLPEQKRIAAILDKADAIRRKRQQAVKLTEELLRSVFLDMFGDPVTNPKGWETLRMDEIIQEGPQNGLYRHESDYGSGTQIVRIDSFYDGEVTGIDALKRVRLDHGTIQKYLLREDDLLINRVNSRKFLGKSAIVPTLQEPTVFESNMMRITLNSTLVCPQYLVNLLQHQYIKSQIDNKAKDAVNQSSINQDDVKSFELRIPPLALQLNFRETKRKIFRVLSYQNKALDDESTLFTSLLQRAFKGEL